jgi:hypothetical protein
MEHIVLNDNNNTCNICNFGDLKVGSSFICYGDDSCEQLIHMKTKNATIYENNKYNAVVISTVNGLLTEYIGSLWYYNPDIRVINVDKYFVASYK